jgi:hypothetical protein
MEGLDPLHRFEISENWRNRNGTLLVIVIAIAKRRGGLSKEESAEIVLSLLETCPPLLSGQVFVEIGEIEKDLSRGGQVTKRHELTSEESLVELKELRDRQQARRERLISLKELAHSNDGME